MSIRHRPKSAININQLVINLENPSLNDLESLNRQLSKYLDKVDEPLDLSFWESVTFTYWSYLNLVKLAGKKYDSCSEEFVKKLNGMATKNMRSSPKPRLPEHIVEPINKTSSNRWLSYITPKYIVGGVVALFVVSVALKIVKDDRD